MLDEQAEPPYCSSACPLAKVPGLRGIRGGARTKRKSEAGRPQDWTGRALGSWEHGEDRKAGSLLGLPPAWSCAADCPPLNPATNVSKKRMLQKQFRVPIALTGLKVGGSRRFKNGIVDDHFSPSEPEHLQGGGGGRGGGSRERTFSSPLSAEVAGVQRHAAAGWLAYEAWCSAAN